MLLPKIIPVTPPEIIIKRKIYDRPNGRLDDMLYDVDDIKNNQL
jgi:hypothetical protein